MIPWLEVSCNAVNAGSIVLAARNSVHTWWTGIVGCTLFAILFYRSQLYADAVLQIFFIATSIYGWHVWLRGMDGSALPVTRVGKKSLGIAIGAAVCVGIGYGLVLRRFTNAYAPLVDSFVLTLSVAAQLLLMKRRYETWWFWLAVNSLSVVLFAFRGLWLTAGLYAAFWVNAWMARRRWRKTLFE